MNNDNRSTHARVSKTTQCVIAALRAQGLPISDEQAESVLIAAIHNAGALRLTKESPRAKMEKCKPGLWDKMDAVLEAAKKFAPDSRVRAKGKFSAAVILPDGVGHDARISVDCVGEQYWISLEEDGAKFPIKWAMPRSEVKNDRADLFLIDVLETYGGGDGNGEACLESAISVVLGISALASRGHCRDALQKKHKLKATQLNASHAHSPANSTGP